MNKQAANNLFIHSSMPRFYQRLLTGIVNYQGLGKRILSEIKTAHAFRQVKKVNELAMVLANMPFKEYQLIGQYYLAWCECRELKYNTESLERIVEQSHIYKTKALLSRGAFDFYKGRFESALYFYAEAFNTQPTISEYIEATKAIAVIKSIEGFQASALKKLESLIPILNHAEPFAYYDVLNSYAVELGETGRKQEARNIIKHVLASPFAIAYPEWLETAEGLRPANRSLVVINQSKYIPRNVLLMPTSEHGDGAKWSDEPARVLDMKKWIKKMGKGKKGNGDKRKPVEEMDEKDMIFRMIELFSKENTSFTQRRKMYEAVEKIASEPDKPDTPDDDTSGA